MPYNKLSTLPMVLFAEINETGDTELLELENHSEVWEKLKAEYDQKYANNQGKKNFNLIKEIDFVSRKYMIIKLCIEALKFSIEPVVLDILLEYNYKIDVSRLHQEIARISEESENILIKITELRNKLPKQEDNNESARDNILKSLAAYSMILGFDIDYYAVSVEKYFLLNKNATDKLKQPNYGK